MEALESRGLLGFKATRGYRETLGCKEAPVSLEAPAWLGLQ